MVALSLQPLLPRVCVSDAGPCARDKLQAPQFQNSTHVTSHSHSLRENHPSGPRRSSRDASRRDSFRPHFSSSLRRPFSLQAPSAAQSDITQDPSAALALVSARPGSDRDETGSLSAVKTNDDDADLKRAKDLLELHAAVKVAHQDGTDRELEQAREDVERVVRGLG